MWASEMILARPSNLVWMCHATWWSTITTTASGYLMKDSETLTVNQSTKRPRACSLEPLLFFSNFPSIRIHPTAVSELPLFRWTSHLPPHPNNQNSRSLEISTGRIQIHRNKKACLHHRKQRKQIKKLQWSRPVEPRYTTEFGQFRAHGSTGQWHPVSKIFIHAIEYNIISPHLSQPTGILQTLKQNEECQWSHMQHVQ